jgi:hypothetical protein
VNELHLTLVTENKAVAEIDSSSDQHVTLKVNDKDTWNAEGLLKLSAMLKGVATVLAAGVLLLFAFGADAEDMADWQKWVTFDVVEANEFP